MRIALAISAAGWRGSGVSYAKIAAGLLERGHRVLLVTVSPAVTARFREAGLPVAELPLHDTGPREIRMLARTLAGFRPDAVMADTPRDLRLVALATLFRRTAVVYRYNCRPSRAPTRLDDRLFVRRARALVFLSEAVRHEAFALAPWLVRRPAFRIPNGFDTTVWRSDPESGRRFRERFGVPAGLPMVLTPGTLARAKGQETAIGALAALARRGGPRVVHVIMGDGPQEGALRTLAARSGVPTVFTGTLLPEDVIAGLSAADLVLHPSERETFGNAVAEAMACGRPVVAAAAPAVAEIVGDDGCAGILVPVGDAGAMADAAGRLLADPAGRDRLGAAARERIEREFPLRRMLDGYEGMFAELADEAGRR